VSSEYPCQHHPTTLPTSHIAPQSKTTIPPFEIYTAMPLISLDAEKPLKNVSESMLCH